MSKLAAVGAAAQKKASAVLRTLLTYKHRTSDIMLLIERPEKMATMLFLRTLQTPI